MAISRASPASASTARTTSSRVSVPAPGAPGPAAAGAGSMAPLATRTNAGCPESRTGRASFSRADSSGPPGRSVQCGTSRESSHRGTTRPIHRCCGSPGPASGHPRMLTSPSSPIRYGSTSEVSGLTRLPKPEFWAITPARTPDRAAPAAVASAVPSLAAGA
nr:hypothetical protein [Nocardiopsis chromatogenes]